MGKINVGTMVYVARGCPKCGNCEDVGKIGTVESMDNHPVFCTHCWFMFPAGVICYWKKGMHPIFVLEPIDGLSDDEKLTEQLFHPYRLPARVEDEPAKPSPIVPQKV